MRLSSLFYASFIFFNHMQEGNQSDKEIQASYESIRGEIVVSQSQLQSKQGVRRMIKKYQSRIAEMLKLIQRQRRQNDTLKSQFKQLNEQLNSLMKKMQPKTKQQQPKSTDARYQLTKKQLQNEIKKNGILRKEIQQLKYKFQYLDGDKIDGFKNQIKEKERIIEDLQAQIKLFQKLDKQEKNCDSYRKQQELTNKIMQQNEEIVHLKKKIVEHKKKEEELEKNIKTLREQTSTLQSKATLKLPEEKNKGKGSDSSSLQQELQKLKDKYKQLQNAKKLNDKSSKHQIDTLNSKLRNLQRELSEVREAVARKDKQSSIMLFKLKEKERKNFNTLQPIKTARYSEEVLHSSSGGLFQARKQYKGLSWGQGVYRQFDDSSKLPAEKNYRIKRLIFTYFQEHILSLTVEYDIVEGYVGKDLKKQTKTIESFAIPTQYNNIQIAEHLFGDYEYIINMDIYCGKGIDFIRITTSKQYILEVGNPKILPKCKKHSFEIGSHEKPIALMGVIEHRKIGGQSKEFLVSLGLQLKKKQVFIRGKSRRVESSLNKSVLMKINNDKNPKND